jgi:hypothetical protein
LATRSILCCILCLLCLAPLRGQSAASPEKGTLYERALSATIMKMEKDWGNIDDSCCLNTSIRTNYRHLPVEKRDEITEELPTQFDKHEVEYLDVQGLMDRYRQLGKKFAILRILPMRENGEYLEVVISVYWFSLEEEKPVYALSEWSIVKFRHDCAKHAWILASVKLVGI